MAIRPELRARTKTPQEEDIYWRFREEVVRRRISTDTAAILDAIEAWIAGPSTNEEKELVSNLLKLLRSPETDDAIKMHLRQLAATVAEEIPAEISPQLVPKDRNRKRLG